MKNKFTWNNIKSFLIKLIKSPFLYVALGLIIVDIISKWCVQLNFGHLSSPPTIHIIPGLIDVTLTHNTGMVFGIGGGTGGRIAIIIIRTILAIIIPLVVFYYSNQIKTRYRVIIVMIYAGCIGNLIDGMFYWEGIVGFNGVIDWIKFPWWGYIFNLADSFIVVAVFLAIIFLIIDEIKEIKIRNRKGEYTLTPEEYEKKMLKEKEQNENNNK